MQPLLVNHGLLLLVLHVVMHLFLELVVVVHGFPGSSDHTVVNVPCVVGHPLLNLLPLPDAAATGQQQKNAPSDGEHIEPHRKSRINDRCAVFAFREPNLLFVGVEDHVVVFEEAIAQVPVVLGLVVQHPYFQQALVRKRRVVHFFSQLNNRHLKDKSVLQLDLQVGQSFERVTESC